MSTRTAAETKTSLRKKLIRLAHDHPEKRATVFPMLTKLGVDVSKLAAPKTAADTRVAAMLTAIAADTSQPKKAATASKLLAKLAKGDKMPPELLEKFKGKGDDKDDKKASVGKVAVKPETEAFGQWVMSTQSIMSPNEVESFVSRTLGVKTLPPQKGRSGPRFQRGDQVIVCASKHKGPGLGTYKLYDNKTGTCVGSEGDDLMLAIKGEPAPIRFENGMKARGVGVYKYSAAYTLKGSAAIEMYYHAGGKPTSDAIIVVDAYLGRGRGTEKRSGGYYTGHIVMAATGKNGYYFRGYPQQRMDIDAKTCGGDTFLPRSFNPAVGKVWYIGLLGHRPNNWKDELKKLAEASQAS